MPELCAPTTHTHGSPPLFPASPLYPTPPICPTPLPRPAPPAILLGAQLWNTFFVGITMFKVCVCVCVSWGGGKGGG